MKLPVSYSIRNIRRRPLHSVMTIAGIAIVVFASVLMMSLVRGLQSRLSVSGEPQNVLVISRQGENQLFSSITEDELVHLVGLPGVAQGSEGRTLVSPEIMHMSIVGSEVDGVLKRAPVYVRGINPVAYEVHQSVRLARGELPREENQVLVGSTLHVKMGVPASMTEPGQALRFEDQDWTISGVFEAGGSLVESEVWMSADVLKRLLNRRTFTMAVARLEGEGSVGAALATFDETGVLQRFFKGWSERGFYAEFGSSLDWILRLAFAMVVIITVAGALIGVNTMYTAVLKRMREIATYRVLGFSPSEVLASFVIEATALASVGGIIGILLGLVVNGLPLKLSYGAFYLVVDSIVIGSGLCLALFIGIIGGLLPALKGVRIAVVDGLRHR